MGILFLMFFILGKFYIFWSMRHHFRWSNWFLPYYTAGWFFTVVFTLMFSFDLDWGQWAANLIIVLTVTFFISDIFLLSLILPTDGFAFFRNWRSGGARQVDKDRRFFIKNLGVIMAGLPFFSFLHGFFLGRYNFKTQKIVIESPHLPASFEGFRLVQFSDFHAGSFDDPSQVKRGLDQIQALNPDLLVFTGDMVNHSYQELDPYHDMLKGLHARYGKFSILGNHDYYGDNGQADVEALVQRQKEMGFRPLINEHQYIELGGDRICLTGVENWGKGPFPKRGRLEDAVEGIENRDFKILLSHDPSHWEMEVKKHALRFDLTLSGHTHGMQIGINLPFLKWSPIKYVYKYWLGHYKEEEENLYVNRGFGWLFFAGRIGMWPEITEFELRRKVSE